jgi:transcriptional regulator with XRE-family HTH domain
MDAATSVQVHGPALRHVRQYRGTTVAQLARVAGVSTSFLAAVERGDRRGVTRRVFDALVSELDLADPRVLLVDPYGGAVARDTATRLEPSATAVLPCRSNTSSTRAA